MSTTNHPGHAVTDSSAAKAASDNGSPVGDAQGDAPEVVVEDELADYGSHVFWWLLAFRLLNASLIRTMFQPDEYFQALEPAWAIAFGPDSGAWITWEWRHQMRSTIPPFMFAGLYWLCDKLAELANLGVPSRAELLIAAPKTLQACIAALGDYYTWRLGELAYGYGGLGHWFALILTVTNPFHFVVITRTLANSTELSLNAAALYLWFTSAPEDPDLQQEADETEASEDGDMSSSCISTKLEESIHKVRDLVTKQVRAYDLNRLRLCLILAAFGCILRITNVLTWLALVSFEFFEYETTWHYMLTLPLLKQRISLPRILPRLRELNRAHGVLVREAALCGSLVLGLSMLLDRHYYGKWTLPAIQFLYVNVAEGVSSFYGTHDVLWYWSQGFPLICGPSVVFAFIQIRHYLFTAPQTPDDFRSIIKYEFSAIAIFVGVVYSLIAHKEARFIYPLLPILSTLAAGPAAAYFRPLFAKTSLSRIMSSSKSSTRLLVGAGVLVFNLLTAIAISMFHQRAPLDVMDYLRHEHEAHYLSQPPAGTGLPQADSSMTVGFLMPCHSTPWRSHFVHPSIKAWALGCEPPLGLTAAERAVYLDEADLFYEAPEAFLLDTLGQPKRPKKHASGWTGWGGHASEGLGTHGQDAQLAFDGRPGAKMWPDYLVFFAEKEDLLGSLLAGTNYAQCWRGWNTWRHDDWRRGGDMVVWCLRDKPVDARLSEMGGVMAQKLTRKVGRMSEN